MTLAAPPRTPDLFLAARLLLADPVATAALGAWFAPRVGAGDTLLLHGPIGAGKTHFARSLIQSRLAASGAAEDVPSPTFTLVQYYDADGLDICHADLFRLTEPGEVFELGLTDAFETALCLVEWPDRLGAYTPEQALTLRFSIESDDLRSVEILASSIRWGSVFDDLRDMGSADG